ARRPRTNAFVPKENHPARPNSDRAPAASCRLKERSRIFLCWQAQLRSTNRPPSRRARSNHLESRSAIRPEPSGSTSRSRLERAPCAPVMFQKRVRRCWAFAARFIGRELALPGIPSIENGLNDAPSLLDHIRPHEQGRIADHHVVEQRLVTDIGLLGEPI